MTNVKAHWTLSSRSLALARSSHCLSVTSTGLAVLYGGELKPRTPVDTEQGAKGAVHVFDVTKKKDDASMLNWHTFCRAASGEGTPEPRVGAATAIIGQTFYLWGGRGGVDLGSPVAGEEIGIWAIDLSDLEGAEWHRLEAANEAEAPEPRSYHTMTSLGSKLYVHAGCPASGRIGELHSFDVTSKMWARLATAPEPGRGGTVLTAVKFKGEGVLARFAGFAGVELGSDHTLDIYYPSSNTWKTTTPSPSTSHGYPGPRSVHGFVPFSHPSYPNAVALLYHGEKEPSKDGHAGAGEFWDDVWLLQSVDGDGSDSLDWIYVSVEGLSPEGRGWFPSASFVDVETGKTKAVLHGGLLSSNERSGELWVLEVG